jgi:hypothetical protein
MHKTSFIIACLMALLALLISHQTALAHETITVGDYEIEVGWVNEPPVAGQQNAIAINVTNTSSAEPVEDVSSLTVTISYGDQSKELTLEPLGEDTPGQFQAAILPTIPGQYTVTLGGQLGETAVDAHAEPEEVAPADTIQFPAAESAGQSANAGAAAWLTWLAVLLGLVGIGLGVTALQKK